MSGPLRCGVYVPTRFVVGLAAALGLASCSCEPSGALEPAPPPAEARPRVADLPPPPPLRSRVERLWVAELATAQAGPRQRVAILDRQRAPGERPADAALLGTVAGEGVHTLHALGELPTPFDVITLVAADELCDVAVERALDVWQSRVAPEPLDDEDERADDELDRPDPRRDEPDRRVLLLALADGCPELATSAALGGARVSRRPLEHAMLSTAGAELVARVQRFEVASGALPSRGPLRAMALSEPGAHLVVVSDSTYVLRDAQVVAVLDGLPLAELTAGARVFLFGADDSLAPLDAMQPGAARRPDSGG